MYTFFGAQVYLFSVSVFTPIFMGVTRQVIIKQATVASIVEEFCVLNNLITKCTSSVFLGLLHLC